MPLTGTCMCGHTSSMHTGPGGGCEAKFLNPHTREPDQCRCTGFCDRGDPD